MSDNDPILILLADDDAEDRLLFTEALKELQIKTSVHTVNDGIELMEYLTQKDNPFPYLIFLDLNMPRKDGLDCLKEIRSNQTLKDIAVVIYSTSESVNDINETFNNGANLYFIKPNDFHKLKQVIQTAFATTYLNPQLPSSKQSFVLRT